MAQRLSGSLNKGTDDEYVVDCDPDNVVGLQELNSHNCKECQ